MPKSFISRHVCTSLSALRIRVERVKGSVFPITRNACWVRRRETFGPYPLQSLEI